MTVSEQTPLQIMRRIKALRGPTRPAAEQSTGLPPARSDAGSVRSSESAGRKAERPGHPLNPSARDHVGGGHMNLTGEPSREGMTYRCPCGQPMGCQGGLAFFDGEIRDYHYLCEVGHRWKNRQIGWSVWAWTYLGEIQSLVEARALA